MYGRPRVGLFVETGFLDKNTSFFWLHAHKT
jgi:hypothetical protein